MFRDRGRNSRDWKELKMKTDDMIAKAKKRWYENETKKLMEQGAHRIAYKALDELGVSERRTQRWNVMDLRADCREEDMAEELADHFSRISNESDPLDLRRLPTTYDRELPQIDELKLIERLRTLKKPKSHVTIDLPNIITTRTAASLGGLLTSLANRIIRGEEWPAIWKEEEVTTIPKNQSPDNLDECRGISCTSIYSKLMETYMLELLQEEAPTGETQYGGQRGIGTDHLLVKMTTDILEGMEDNRGAVSVVSIDFSKAFNRMAHGPCMERLAARGASNQALHISASFLSGRKMRTKVGSVLSSRREAPGGAPQGTKSGNYFFAISIDEVEREDDQQLDRLNLNDTTTGTPGIEERREDINDDSRVDMNEGPRPFDPDNSFNVSREDRRIYGKSTTPSSRLDDTLPGASQEELETETRKPERWNPGEAWTLKFVDDITMGATNLVEHSVRHVTTSKERRSIPARDLERACQRVVVNSAKVGMRVNPEKTQLMCISGSINYEVTSHLTVAGQKIESGDNLKVLGLYLDSKCTMNAHVKSIKRKFAARLWIIRHLKRAKLEADKLVKVYCALIRPCFEYAAPAFHPMLTQTHTVELERMQSIALKTIHGWNFSHRKVLEKSGLETLERRRFDICKRFAEKCAANPRFQPWFPVRERTRSLRNQERFEVGFARHERLRNSPIHFMRRILNNQETGPEATTSYEDLDG